ncbi:IclR family transcriptional regulator [Companilactobacillus nuruki]|uniref:IclR family transcriptional regulator n=1 Tax=Companilactobacillus nuruki TaxID=1993540 RepID=A0A2N7AXU5_9LACO|nr:IclR family transcriptional regulator [Companilactobacillus nuruki]PMD73903.1 hypothetical protein CBP76_00735 [Companilactobacillus nuruki]
MANSSSTLRNGLAILALLRKNGGLRLTEISNQLILNKSTVLRLLDTLMELNYVKKIDKHYSIKHNNSDPYLNWISIPVSKEITNHFQTTAFIGILRNENVVITQVLPAKKGFEEFKVLGNSTPINLSALGKGIVAFLSDEQQVNIVKKLTFDKGTKYTITGQKTFLKNLKITAQKGYALDDEESSIGIRCLAVPIYRNGQVIASLGISGSFERLPRQKLQSIAKELIKCSQQITNEFF